MEHEQIEAEIRDALALAVRGIPLSDRLFSPGGLFSRLASTEDERRQLVSTPLFQQAQRRLTELMKQEAEEFGKAVRSSEAAFPKESHLHKIERTGGE
jgi:hypothetical protein